jgi:hypothetical protein
MKTLCLLTATWLSVAAQQPAAGQCNCATAQPQVIAVQNDAAPPETLGARLRRLFAGHEQVSPYHCTSCTQPAAVPVAVAPTPCSCSTPATVPVVAAVQPVNLQVAKKYENKVGHETDYSWVTGHLFYVHTDGGRWVVRYGRPDEVDKFGGSMVLAPTVEMRNFREGDLVCVFGQVIDEGRSSRPLGGALYRVNAISMVERSDP